MDKKNRWMVGWIQKWIKQIMDGWMKKTYMKKKLTYEKNFKNRWMVGWTGKMEGWLDGQTNGWLMDRKIDGWLDGQKNRMDGWKDINKNMIKKIDGWLDGQKKQMDGWMDGQKKIDDIKMYGSKEKMDGWMDG